MVQPSEAEFKSGQGDGVEASETNVTRLLVRRSAKSRGAEAVLTMLFSAVFLFVATNVSSGSDPNIIFGMHDGNSATVTSGLPPDHPVGTKATVALLSFKRTVHLHEPCLSAFIVDYLPGGSAVLHRSPTAGYVLVHVLSGEIRAQAWDAGMGTYRPGQTWVESAIANNIVTKNASTVAPARALVVLMTNETNSQRSEDR
ncbi:hypothetical protein [Bradyrhizobium sp. SYSU BS000235]|uniref:hypothetical protein n=1 Tax=Bradyrhizobium sp. SYSU BS000235 TaxID=3411332 RepID=UPI003C70C2DD